MPAGNAISSAITMPANPSDNVAGRRSINVTVTGSPLRKLTPRSPVAAEPTNPKNCETIGRSRPLADRNASYASGV